MSNYNEYKTEQQSNITWGETFKMGVKAPLIADRIFETYQDALNFVDVDENPQTSAVAGLIVSVIHDTTHLQPGSTEPNKNGIYYITYVFDENGNIRLNEQGLQYLHLSRHTAEQVQSDWDETNADSPSFIQHKPYIPEDYRTVNHEVVIGDDTNINIHDGYYFPNAVQDYDGNWYGAVIIGDQVWLGENLRVTHLTDGTPIQDGGSNMSDSIMYRYDNTSSSVPFEKRGYLYNYQAAISQYISMEGWKVPERNDFESLSENDKITLFDYVCRQKRYTLGDNRNNIAKSLASAQYWQPASIPYSVGNNEKENNATGFSAFPTGYMIHDGTYQNGARIWSATDSTNDNTKAFCMQLNHDSPTLVVGENPNGMLYLTDKISACSIRLICKMNPVEFRAWYLLQYGTMQHHVQTPMVTNGKTYVYNPSTGLMEAVVTGNDIPLADNAGEMPNVTRLEHMPTSNENPGMYAYNGNVYRWDGITSDLWNLDQNTTVSDAITVLNYLSNDLDMGQYFL